MPQQSSEDLPKIDAYFAAPVQVSPWRSRGLLWGLAIGVCVWTAALFTTGRNHSESSVIEADPFAEAPWLTSLNTDESAEHPKPNFQ